MPLDQNVWLAQDDPVDQDEFDEPACHYCIEVPRKMRIWPPRIPNRCHRRKCGKRTKSDACGDGSVHITCPHPPRDIPYKVEGLVRHLRDTGVFSPQDTFARFDL